MASLNFYKSPRSLLNNENIIFGKQITKQGTNSIVKSKKKALADVGNTILQKENMNSFKKLGLPNEMKKNILPKCKSPMFSPSLKIAEDDIIADEHHNWCANPGLVNDENDFFLPKFEFTQEEIKSYCLDWNVKPPANKLKRKTIDIKESITDPKSPSWCDMIRDNPVLDIIDDLTFDIPMAEMSDDSFFDTSDDSTFDIVLSPPF